MVGRCCCCLGINYFHFACWFSTTILALVLNSLVRVSRRVSKTILTRSLKAPQATRCPANRKWVAPGFLPLLTSCDSILSHRWALHLRLFIPRGSWPNCRIHFYCFRLNDFKSFNSLFKALFIFPSQYLFAIGFLHIFSLRRSLSPA